jgi:hypothetical protein
MLNVGRLNICGLDGAGLNVGGLNVGGAERRRSGHRKPRCRKIPNVAGLNVDIINFFVYIVIKIKKKSKNVPRNCRKSATNFA